MTFIVLNTDQFAEICPCSIAGDRGMKINVVVYTYINLDKLDTRSMNHRFHLKLPLDVDYLARQNFVFTNIK